MLHAHQVACEAWLKTHGKLPVNVKFVIEGEEEVGSEQPRHASSQSTSEQLACDVCVISDTSQYGTRHPGHHLRTAGHFAYEVDLRGPKQDLHSGIFGGAVANPVNALAGWSRQLIDAEGRVQIPGFYDDVIPLTDEERQAVCEPAVRRGDVLSVDRRRPHRRAKRASPRSNAAGPGRRATSTASSAAIRAKAPRR